MIKIFQRKAGDVKIIKHSKIVWKSPYHAQIFDNDGIHIGSIWKSKE